MKPLVLSTLLLAGLALSVQSNPVQANPVQDRLVAGLRAQGYVILEDGFTFLGRLRIVAENDRMHREIVVNPGTGEVLRDYAILLTDMTPPTKPPAGSSHSDNGPAVANATPPAAMPPVAAAMIEATPSAAPEFDPSATMLSTDPVAPGKP